MQSKRKKDIEKATDWIELPLNMGVEDAAAVLDCAPDYVRRRCISGEIPSFRLGQRFRIPKANLQRYIEDQMNTKSPAGQ